MSVNILALDPANNTGWCIDDGTTLGAGTLPITAKGDQHPGRRLERLRQFIFKVQRSAPIDLLVYEDAVLGSHFFQTQILHSELRGVILLTAAEMEIPVLSVNPMTLKKWLTGHGGAKKKDMIESVRQRFGFITTDDDQADSVALAKYGRAVHTRVVESTAKLPF